MSIGFLVLSNKFFALLQTFRDRRQILLPYINPLRPGIAYLYPLGTENLQVF